MKMKQNMVLADRAARIVLAGLAVWPALVVGPGSPGGIAILAVAGIFTATSLSGFCPLYLAFGRLSHGRHSARHPT